MSNAPSDDKPDEIVVTIVGGDEREPLLGHHATGNGHPSLANATRAVMAAQSISRSPSSFERMASLTRSLSDSRSGVLRRAAASWVAGAEETFMCQICLCHERLRDSCEVTPCKHLFCTCCLLEYVNGQISDGITDIQCPSIEEESSQRCQVRAGLGCEAWAGGEAERACESSNVVGTEVVGSLAPPSPGQPVCLCPAAAGGCPRRSQYCSGAHFSLIA